MTSTISLSKVEQYFKGILKMFLVSALVALILATITAVVVRLPVPGLQVETADASFFFGLFLGYFWSPIILYFILKEDFEEFLSSLKEAEE